MKIEQALISQLMILLNFIPLAFSVTSPIILALTPFFLSISANSFAYSGLTVRRSVPFEYVKSKYPEKIIGVSTYGSREDAVKFQKLGADYVAFGSFFRIF